MAGEKTNIISPAGFAALRLLRFTRAEVATRRALALGRAFITRCIFARALLLLSGGVVGESTAGNERGGEEG